MQDKITLKRQYGSDFLAVPKGMEHLFSTGQVEKGSVIRRDLFRAFSYFGADQLPYYDRTTDEVATFETPPDDRKRYVAIAPRTIEAEIELRKEFAGQLGDPEVSAQLIRDLNVPRRELTNFTRTIRSKGYQREWYAFQNNDILERIRQWARNNEIQWNEKWIETREDQYLKNLRLYAGKTDRSSVDAKLTNAISMLSDEDTK